MTLSRMNIFSLHERKIYFMTSTLAHISEAWWPFGFCMNQNQSNIDDHVVH